MSILSKSAITIFADYSINDSSCNECMEQLSATSDAENTEKRFKFDFDKWWESLNLECDCDSGLDLYDIISFIWVFLLVFLHVN